MSKAAHPDRPDDVEAGEGARESDSLLPVTGQAPASRVAQQTASEGQLLRGVAEFGLCFAALQASYLLWGMMQELIMNTTFDPTPLTPSGHFPSAVFCVFSNRILAIAVSAAVCYWKHGTLSFGAPFLSFVPCALSNTVSSWSQYEALVFVSFALQTIFKSIKILPVMLMGSVLKGTRYKLTEYAEAAVITAGVMLFSLSKTSWVAATPKYELLGVGLLSLYILSDSFTSQWQSRVYRDHPSIDSFQMMFGVNAAAVLLTAAALLASGELPTTIEFLQANPTALYYNIVTAVCSSSGQFVIYYIIKRYGPVVFTIMMTTRQMLSIVISNYYFSHTMPAQSYVGCALVFSAILFSSYRQLQRPRSAQGGK